jgi:hypothetical protein
MVEYTCLQRGPLPAKLKRRSHGWRKDHGRCNRDKAHRSDRLFHFVNKPWQFVILAGGFIAGHPRLPKFAACLRTTHDINLLRKAGRGRLRLLQMHAQATDFCNKYPSSLLVEASEIFLKQQPRLNVCRRSGTSIDTVAWCP